MFDNLPLAAIIADKATQNKVFCVHGGIGSSAMKIEEIEKIKRPCEINLGEITTQEQQLVVDLLWSDPTDNEEEMGIHPNQIRDPLGQNNIMKFGPDRVEKFLKTNNMSMILRSH
jgi:protein phosphatase